VKRSTEEGRATVSESKREQARRMMNESHREVFDDLARQELTKRPGQTPKELARSMGIEYDEIFVGNLELARDRTSAPFHQEPVLPGTPEHTSGDAE
jgi:hypothetical protein